MATQQGASSRPWFRLATMVRPTPSPLPPTIQQPDQAPPPPRPAFIRPAFTQAPSAVAPPPNVVAQTPPPVARDMTIPNEPHPSAVATSPPSRVESPSMRAPTMTRVTSSSSPPAISHPPSPLVLPSPQVKSYQPEYEQKAMLMLETKEKPKGLEDNVGSRSHSTKPHETSRKHSDSQDARMRIITIAGENKGAIMDLTPLNRKTYKFARNIKKDNLSPSSDDDKSGSNSDGRSKAKNKNQKPNSPLMSAVMNSNVQGVNNSILYNCSTTHHDPGVHLSLSRKPDGRGFNSI